MEAVWVYLLKTAACLTLFYVCFKAFFSRDTLYRVNRKILVAGTCICFLLPFIKTQTPYPSVFQTLLTNLEYSLTPGNTLSFSAGNDTRQINFPTGEHILLQKGDNRTPAPLSIHTVLLTIFILGGMVNGILLWRSLRAAKKIIRRGEKMEQEGYTLVVIPEDISPFSRNRTLVISRNDYENHAQEIILHETAHIRQHHSRDLLLFEILIFFQWFNPCIWLLRKELQDIHEYLADDQVLRSGINATRYQLLLVKKAVGSSSYTLANSFNHSKIKKRITMMLKEKTTLWAQFKMIVLFSAASMVVYAFAEPKADQLPALPAISPDTTCKVTQIFQKKEMRIGIPTDSLFTSVIHQLKAIDPALQGSRQKNLVEVLFKDNTGTILSTVRIGKQDSPKTLIEEAIKEIPKEKIDIVAIQTAHDTTIGLVKKVKQSLREIGLLRIVYSTGEQKKS